MHLNLLITDAESRLRGNAALDPRRIFEMGSGVLAAASRAKFKRSF
jgi:hypothetical protein